MKFYLALKDRGVPVYLMESGAISDMLSGRDFIGVVPDGVRPWRCEDLFPDEKLIDFINLPTENTYAVSKKILWYPLEEAKLADEGAKPGNIEGRKTKKRGMRDPEKTIGNLIDKQSVSFVGSVDDEGFPNMKAMLPPRKREGIRAFWFTTNTSSLRVAQYRAEPRACIYFFDKRFFRGVMLRGTMEVLEDAAAKEMIWQEGDTLYYPGGVGDPDYCVLKFTASDGRYYANFASEDFDV
jgi:general stress protein 26